MRKYMFLICFFCLLPILNGCGPKAPSDKVVLWHWMTDREESLKKLAAQYTQETGIKINVELFAPSEAYSQKIIASAQANVLPDIFGILDKKSIIADFITANKVADLTADFESDNGAWKSVIFDKALATNRFEPGNMYNIKPGIYGVPIDVTNMQMLYNKKLLAKAGIATPPKTFDEFIKAIRALKRIGVPAFVSGWGELWLAECFASNYAFNIMGEEKIMDTYRGKVPYTDPDWVKVLDIFRQLRDEGALIDGIVTKGNKYAEQDFALERAAFTFNGSWSVNVYKDMNASLEYGVIPPPPVTSPYPLKIWGGAGSSFMVNAQSPNKDKAIAFLKWLTAKEQQAVLAKETNNLPSNQNAMDLIPPILESFGKGMDSSTHPTIWPLNEDPLVGEAFTKGIQSIIIGEKTPAQVAAIVQAVKVKQMAKQNR